MKKIFLGLLCGIFLFTITGCMGDSKTNDDINKQDDNKINLNDNIEVSIITKSTGTKNCFFYMFITNLKEVFPNIKIDTYDNYQSVSYWPGRAADASTSEISEEAVNNNINSLKFNSAKEAEIINLFKEYQSSTYKGIKSVEYEFEDHRLSFTYNYLTFKDNTYNLNSEALDLKVQQILLDAIKFKGPCGGFDFSEDSILNEDLCDEYNLNCGRW